MFKKIFVEITNRCNLACDFCRVSRRPKADLTPAAFARLLPQLAPFTRHLSLHVLGEPLLHPQLDQFLALSQAQGIQVNLTTNGTLLPRHGPMLLAAPFLRQVNISLHSVSGRCSGFDPGAYLTGVLEFSRRAAARGIYVSLRIWDLPSQEGNAEERWQNELLSRLEKFFALSEPLAGTAGVGQGVKLAEKIYLSQKDLFAWPSLAEPDLGERGTCRGLRDQVAILVDGTVVPCCLDAEGNMPLGNVFEEPFGEIVAGARAARISRGFRERNVVEELCRRCSYRERF
jgi:radical SAM protein with 4Fe4S-binding SPASM domain